MRPILPIVFSMLLSVSVPLMAQAEEGKGPSFELGAKGGYALVTFFRGTGVQGSSQLRARNSFLVGASSQYRMYATDRVNLGVEADLLFIRRGAEAEYDGHVDTSWQLSYFELPVLVRVLLPLSGWVDPYIAAGPRLGFLLSAKSTDTNGNVRDEADGTSTLDVGFSAGAGALIHTGSRVMLSLEGRYDQSFMNRIDSVDTTADQRHRAFFLMLGVSMGIGGRAPASADASPAP